MFQTFFCLQELDLEKRQRLVKTYVHNPNNISLFPSHLESMRILGRFFWSHSREYFPGSRDFNVHLQLISILTNDHMWKIFKNPIKSSISLKISSLYVRFNFYLNLSSVKTFVDDFNGEVGNN